jgi:hypothetical protein
MIDQYQCSICKEFVLELAKRVITTSQTYFVCEKCSKKSYYIHTDGRLLHNMGFGTS